MSPPAPIIGGARAGDGRERRRGERAAARARRLRLQIDVSGAYDEASAGVVAAFQRHFRPRLVDGRADRSTHRDAARARRAGRARMSEKRSVVVTGVSTGIGYRAARGADARGLSRLRQRPHAGRQRAARGALRRGVLHPAPLRRDRRAGGGAGGAGDRAAARRRDARRPRQQCRRGLARPAAHQPLEEFRRQIEINLIGQLAVTQAFAPLLGASPETPRRGPPGRIVNMSSVAGRSPRPFSAPMPPPNMRSKACPTRCGAS